MPQPFLPLRGLYAVTPDRPDTEQLVAEVSAVLDGGCRWVQYRNKHADKALRHWQATSLVALCHGKGAALIVNDDLALALETGADGLHAGRDDGDLADLRRALGPNRLLGVSCYNEAARVDAAVLAGADYVALGAMYPSGTKPGAVRASLDLLRDTAGRVAVPVATIGGITRDNARHLIDAGADLVAVISDLFESPDPTARAREFQQLFN